MIRTGLIITGVVGAMLTPAFAPAQVNIEQIVRQKVQPILPKNGEGGGVAVAVRMDGKTVNAHLKLGLAWQNVTGGNLRILSTKTAD